MPHHTPPKTAFSLFASCLFLAATQPAHALLIRDDLSLSDYTDQAALSPFNATGGLHINDDFESSGVLIAPNVVLGASHAAAAASAAGRTFVIGGVAYEIAAVTRLDPTGPLDATDGRDVALYTLTESVAGITPASLYNGTSESLVGREAVYTGAGFQGTGATGPSGLDGVVLAGTNIIDAAGLTVTDASGVETVFADSIVFADFDDPSGSTPNFLGDAAATALETQAAVGDSGGGLFVFNATSGRYELAGLHSFVLAGAQIGFGSGTASTTFLPDDLAVIQAAIPEPATAWLLVSGLATLTRRRR